MNTPIGFFALGRFTSPSTTQMERVLGGGGGPYTTTCGRGRAGAYTMRSGGECLSAHNTVRCTCNLLILHVCLNIGYVRTGME